MAIVYRQITRLAIALLVMFTVAQIPPLAYQKWAVSVFVLGLLLLVAVLLIGHVGKGAQRWLDLGFMKFQPSEIMKNMRRSTEKTQINPDRKVHQLPS